MMIEILLVFLSFLGEKFGISQIRAVFAKNAVVLPGRPHNV